MDEVIEYLKKNPQGVSIKDVQYALQLGPITARKLVQEYGKPNGEYNGTGCLYVFNDDPKLAETVKKLKKSEMNQQRLENIRNQILEWMIEGDVDVIAWAEDPLKRSPHHFRRSTS